ncbi:MAG: hypothetical protein E7122_08235 [Bacteroidales bacterium]|nr:hypothetical protein [Bacteroidales bacterium]
MAEPQSPNGRGVAMAEPQSPNGSGEGNGGASIPQRQRSGEWRSLNPPATAESGEWRSLNPQAAAEWGMAEPQSHHGSGVGNGGALIPLRQRSGNAGASIPQRQRSGNAGGDQGGHNPCIPSPKPMRTRISVPHTYNVLIGENSQYNKNTNCFFTPLRGILMFVSS